MKRIVLFFTVIAALAAPFANALEKPLILSTIKPVHALVCAIVGEMADCQQIVPDYASPHHYSLKPSDIRRLNNADLVFRIDPNMEAQLNKGLAILDPEKLIVLSGAKGIELLDAGHEHGDESHDDKQKEADAADAKDYHLWLDPNNAIVMSEAIRDALIKAIPEHTAILKENTQRLTDAIRLADTDITKSLSTVQDEPFLVMHDAWQYFIHHYGLKQLGSITQQEGLKPSGKAISSARELIRGSGVHCIVNEPGVKSRTLAVLTEDMDVKSTEIDPLGRQIPTSDLAYTELLHYTATQLLNCLKPD